MKSYEVIETDRKFMHGLPIYARIDGKNFSTFTRNMKKPYDETLSRIMQDVTKYLVEETGAAIGYTQSDEISLCWFCESENSESLFNGKVQKMTSILAGMASAKFAIEITKKMPEFLDKIPCFDARTCSTPTKDECANFFLWRENDATKNSISMAASSFYSHKELQNKNGNEKQEMLFQKGVNFNDYPTFFKRGSYFQRKTILRELTPGELQNIPEKHRPAHGTLLERHIIEEIAMPRLSTVVNKVDVIFNKATPIIKENDILSVPNIQKIPKLSNEPVNPPTI